MRLKENIIKVKEL